MLQKGVKFEIEALSVSSLSFLSDEYIPAKIQNGEHIWLYTLYNLLLDSLCTFDFYFCAYQGFMPH